jgi:hypothetical protein
VSPSQSGHLVCPVLAAWTGALIVLVVSASRTIPPVVLSFLLPYLILVAWHLLAFQRRAETDRIPFPKDSAPMPRLGIDPEVATSTPSVSLDAGADLSEVPETSPAHGTERRLSTSAPVRARRRIKPKAVPELSPASWVQVGPGRFVRGEESQPSHNASAEDEPIIQALDTSLELADEDPDDSGLSVDAAREGLVVGDPAGPTELPVTAPAASQPGDSAFPLQHDEDHVPMVEAVPAEPGSA